MAASALGQWWLLRPLDCFAMLAFGGCFGHKVLTLQRAQEKISLGITCAVSESSSFECGNDNGKYGDSHLAVFLSNAISSMPLNLIRCINKKDRIMLIDLLNMELGWLCAVGRSIATPEAWERKDTTPKA